LAVATQQNPLHRHCICIALDNGTDGSLQESESGQVFDAPTERKGGTQGIAIINNIVIGECQKTRTSKNNGIMVTTQGNGTSPPRTAKSKPPVAVECGKIRQKNKCRQS
jgi:hypothetical protein